MSVDQDGLRAIAEECVALVRAEFGVGLDWSIDSLGVLDEICASLRQDPGFVGERFDLWWKLIGAYTGQVTVQLYGGEWIEHEMAPGAYAVVALGITGFPFGITHKVLNGEDFKSLASFARSLPAIAARNAPNP